MTRTRSRKEIWHYILSNEHVHPLAELRESGCLLASSSGSDVCALEFSTETILSLCLHYVLLVTASRQLFFFLSSGSLVFFFAALISAAQEQPMRRHSAALSATANLLRVQVVFFALLTLPLKRMERDKKICPQRLICVRTAED